MGRIKSKQNDGQVFVLTEREVNYLMILNTSLTFHTWKDKIISGFLYLVCTTRFGFSEKDNLIFEIDLESDKRELIVRQIPGEAVGKAIKDLT